MTWFLETLITPSDSNVYGNSQSHYFLPVLSRRRVLRHEADGAFDTRFQAEVGRVHTYSCSAEWWGEEKVLDVVFALQLGGTLIKDERYVWGFTPSIFIDSTAILKRLFMAAFELVDWFTDMQGSQILSPDILSGHEDLFKSNRKLAIYFLKSEF
jgi:hypothetical protein